MNQNQAYNYFFKIPFYRHSIKPVHILNNEGQIVGSLQRIYNCLYDRVIDAFLSLANKKNFIVKLRDSPKSFFSAAPVPYKESLFRDKWIILISEKGDSQQIGMFINTSKIKTNPRFEYTKNNQTFIFKNGFLDKNIYVEDESKQVIARIFYEKVTSMRSTYIHIQQENVLNHDELLLLAFIFTSITD